MLGVVYLFFSVIALVGSLFHLLQFRWDWLYDEITTKQLQANFQNYHPDYLGLPAEFWGTLLLGLCLCLALEGACKLRQSARDHYL